jgi:RHS repeat-associated protein
VASYTLTARATDNLGIENTSSPVNITVQGQAAAGLYFIHTDHLNTPRLIANETGQTAWQWENIDPFGGNAPNENPAGLGTLTCNLRLSGQYFDKETNLHYNYFRDYDPAIGRYIQSDPIGLQGGINTYAYVNSNPLSKIDPLGLAPAGGPPPANCPCSGGIWDQEVGDFQFTAAFGGYVSVGHINLSCRSNPSLKCRGRQICIGGGAIAGISGGWNLIGTTYSAPTAGGLGGWASSGTLVGSVTSARGVNVTVTQQLGGGGSLGGGLDLGLKFGLAYTNCYVDYLTCTGCPCQ